MKNLLFQQTANLFRASLFGSFLLGFVACQKADPAPLGVEVSYTIPSSFTASVNGSPTQTFTGTKSSSSGNIVLKGTNTFYTITITFPSTTGPGTYFFSTTGFSATIFDGVNTYSTSTSPGGGIFTINSINNGLYNGNFNITGYDISSHAMPADGNFSNL
jgi:hypothetical protein